MKEWLGGRPRAAVVLGAVVLGGCTERVTVTARATDDTGLTWQADATFTADEDG
jgi:hypothetical protein